MKLVDLIPDADALLALEPDELGLRLLPVLATWRQPGAQLQPSQFIPSIVGSANNPDYRGQYPSNRRAEIEQALREAWAWLEGQALLFTIPAGWDRTKFANSVAVHNDWGRTRTHVVF